MPVRHRTFASINLHSTSSAIPWAHHLDTVQVVCDLSDTLLRGSAKASLLDPQGVHGLHSRHHESSSYGGQASDALFLAVQFARIACMHEAGGPRQQACREGSLVGR